jgi:hypothetical protein
LAASLPPLHTVLRASLFTRQRRCGRRGCRCAKGAGHLTTYLATSRPGGRTEQISLPPALVPVARRWVAAYQRWWRVVEQISAINRVLMRRRWVEPLGPRGRRPAA